MHFTDFDVRFQLPGQQSEIGNAAVNGQPCHSLAHVGYTQAREPYNTFCVVFAAKIVEQIDPLISTPLTSRLYPAQ